MKKYFIVLIIIICSGSGTLIAQVQKQLSPKFAEHIIALVETVGKNIADLKGENQLGTVYKCKCKLEGFEINYFAGKDGDPDALIAYVKPANTTAFLKQMIDKIWTETNYKVKEQTESRSEDPDVKQEFIVRKPYQSATKSSPIAFLITVKTVKDNFKKTSWDEIQIFMEKP